MKFLYFFLYTNMLKVKQLQWKCGGTIGGTSKLAFEIFVIFHLVDGGFESGLRTIGTSIDVNGRLFLCLKSSIRKAFLAFSLNLSQPDSIYINLLMRVQLRVYRGESPRV
ncbi:hypothetical protein [Mixta calida]|uniref:hypothetical protein n=1 Tax=Mixta calida TaxID=665913 RepID=UPI00289D6879|nr:hypothetical protein [Mixta calida]